MTSFRKLLIPCLAVGGMLFAAAGMIHAQDANEPGYIRISDGQVASPLLPVNSSQISVASAQGQPIATAGCQQCQTGNCQYGNCPQGGCPQGGCPQCSHFGPCANGCHAHKCTHHIHQILDILNPCGACTHSPDHGYAVPTKVPAYRRGVAYQKYFPDAWMGHQTPDMTGMQRAPVVYMPTDTTQLGYYYQQVPQWRPVRGMVPPAPNPKQWHLNCHLQGQGCPQGAVGGEVYSTVAPTPVHDNGVPGDVIEAPHAAPIEQAPAPQQYSPAPEAVPAPDAAAAVEKANYQALFTAE